MELRAIIISGSTRHKSNSLLLAKKALQKLEENGITSELIELRKFKILDCTSCRKCIDTRNCCIRDDMSSTIIPLLLKSHIIVISTPVYFDNVTGIVKRFIDRTWCIRGFLRNKVLGAIAVGRGYGLDMAIVSIYNWGLKHEMIIGHRGVRARGYEYGDVLNDHRALSDLDSMCSRLAELAHLIYR